MTTSIATTREAASLRARPRGALRKERARHDRRGLHVTGADGDALTAFEAALHAFQSWRTGAEAELARALVAAPAFAMAHVLEAYLHLCSRDPRRVRGAWQPYRRLLALPTNEREQLHVAAIGATLADDYEGAKRWLGVLLRAYPRDVLALQVAHAFDYVTGDVQRMTARLETVLPAWSQAVPGYAAVLAMRAFSLIECGQHHDGLDLGLQALALDPGDGRAHHAVAHAYEMADRPDLGARWLRESADAWSLGTVVATHCWWHLALFHLALGELETALEIHDARIRAGGLRELADLLDASALLWRVELLGGESGERWGEVAAAWVGHANDAFCSFNDVHAMLAFVGARDWGAGSALERALQQHRRAATRYGATTRTLGLPACRGILAYARGHYAAAVALLGRLSPRVTALGGSHAQRDVLYLTLLAAIGKARGRATRFAA